MLGHISGAYAARVSRDLSLASRFDFNVYSYESEWSMGAEWWQRRGKVRHPSDSPDAPQPSLPDLVDEVQGVVKAKVSTTTVRSSRHFLHDCWANASIGQDVSLLWEGRLRNVLVSLGVVSNLSSRSKPIKSIGLELSYFSSG